MTTENKAITLLRNLVKATNAYAKAPLHEEEIRAKRKAWNKAMEDAESFLRNKPEPETEQLLYENQP
jgi:hypothetical protein